MIIDKLVTHQLSLAIGKSFCICLCSLLASCTSPSKKINKPIAVPTEPTATKDKADTIESGKHKESKSVKVYTAAPPVPKLIQPISQEKNAFTSTKISTIKGMITIRKGHRGKPDSIILGGKIIFVSPDTYLDIIGLIRFQNEDVALITSQGGGTAHVFKETYALRIKPQDKIIVEKFGDSIPDESAGTSFNSRIALGVNSVSFIGDLYKGKKEICTISTGRQIQCHKQNVRITELSFEECNSAIELIKICAKEDNPIAKLDWLIFSNADSHKLNYLANSTTGLNFVNFEKFCIEATHSKKVPNEDVLRSQICSGASIEQWENEDL